jgi:hypothetical protein
MEHGKLTICKMVQGNALPFWLLGNRLCDVDPDELWKVHQSPRKTDVPQ